MENEATILISHHTVKSREVTEKDLERVIEDGAKMYEAVDKQVGVFRGGLALAHSQITDEDPLCFFVTVEGECIVNPKIVNHTKVPCRKEEGCLTFHTAEYGIKTVERYHKCDVEYYLVEEDGSLSEKIKEKCSGKRAQIFQHEINHFNGKYIWEPQESTQ